MLFPSWLQRLFIVFALGAGLLALALHRAPALPGGGLQ